MQKGCAVKRGPHGEDNPTRSSHATRSTSPSPVGVSSEDTRATNDHFSGAWKWSRDRSINEKTGAEEQIMAARRTLERTDTGMQLDLFEM